MNPRGFASDNAASVHPEVLAAIAAANVDHATAYGDEPWTERARAAIRRELGEQAESFVVFNGTGANNVCLAALCRPWESVICAASAHIANDESTAPESVARVRLQTVAAPDGKLTPELAATKVVRVGEEHAAQPRVISITQSTELGTVYAVEEIRALADYAHAHDLYLHVDGARIFNGAAACGATLREMVTDAGVDALSLGATKAGALGVEAAVFLKPELAANVKYVRKHLMQLASKQRFLSVQLEALLTDELGLRAAAHANAMAARLAAAVHDIPGVTLSNEPAANALFAVLDPAVTAELQKDWRFYVWDATTGEVRWMTAWDTTEHDVDRFAAAIRGTTERLTAAPAR
jgi:threonine aldolase